jgi:medium-chain acyl-[acyl-carrier-protein] hydrolase
MSRRPGPIWEATDTGHSQVIRSTSGAGKWIQRLRHQSDCIRLLCFPHAGGGASAFESWRTTFPSGIDICPVQYPGRENRWGDSFAADLTDLLAALAEDLAQIWRQPFAFLGHSFGALVAFELARVLIHQGYPPPVRLFLTGARAPHLPRRPPIHALSEPDFIDRLSEFSGMLDEVVNNDELMRLTLPIIRADFRLVETHDFDAGVPVPVPISVFGGLQDPTVPISDLLAWSSLTSKAFRSRFIEGDHFFLFRCANRVADWIAEDLAASAAAAETQTARSGAV